MARSKDRRAAAGARAPSVKVVATEDELHRSVAMFLDWMVLPPAVWTTFPAGWGKLGRATAGQLKASGLKPGMPDILVFYNGSTIGVELKATAIVSAAQIATFDQLAKAGVPVYVCHDIDSVHHYLADVHHVPMRPYHYGYPSNVPAAEARRAAQSNASKAHATQEITDGQ